MSDENDPSRTAPISSVLVTGAGGFIGTTVLTQLQRDGIDVIGVDGRLDGLRQRRNVESLGALGSSVHACDLVDDAFDEYIDAVDAVIHLAGSPGVQTSWASGFDHHVRNNLVSTQRLLESALHRPLRKIVVASSSSIYGNVASGAVEEDAVPTPVSPYGASKAGMELLLTSYVERGVRVQALRYFTVYGPHQRPDMALHRIIEATRGGPVFEVRGDGEQSRSFTYVGDIAAATIAALHVRSTETVNVAGTSTASLNEIIAMVEEITGATVERRTVAPVPGDPRRTSAKIERARKMLGWEPEVDLRAGIEAQVKWQLGQGPLRVDGGPFPPN